MVFKYPCKFIPEIPKWSILKYMPKDGNLVFDPFRDQELPCWKQSSLDMILLEQR